MWEIENLSFFVSDQRSGVGPLSSLTHFPIWTQAYAMGWDCEQLRFAKEWLALLDRCWKVLLDALLGLGEY